MDEDDREILGGQLLNLAEIQGCIANGEITADDIWVATDSANTDLEKNQWDEQSVVEFIRVLLPQDYKKSEWAKSSANSRHACDVYVLRFDDIAWERDSLALKHYCKFSADLFGSLTICLMSCHPSKY